MVDKRCPRCDDYDEVVEELKKEKDSRERGAKDALHKCEERNKVRDKKIKGLEKKILTMTIAAVVGGTIVGKDVLDKIAEYIQSFNSIKDTASKLISTLPNEPPEENKNDEEVEELEYTRTLTLAPRKIDTGEWPILMSTSDIKSYQSKININYGLSLSSFIDIPDSNIPTLTDILLEIIIDKPFDIETELVLLDGSPPPIEFTSIPPILSEPMIPNTFITSEVPESSSWVILAGIPIIFLRRRRN